MSPQFSNWWQLSRLWAYSIHSRISSWQTHIPFLTLTLDRNHIQLISQRRLNCSLIGSLTACLPFKNKIDNSMNRSPCWTRQFNNCSIYHEANNSKVWVKKMKKNDTTMVFLLRNIQKNQEKAHEKRLQHRLCLRKARNNLAKDMKTPSHLKLWLLKKDKTHLWMAKRFYSRQCLFSMKVNSFTV